MKLSNKQMYFLHWAKSRIVSKGLQEPFASKINHILKIGEYPPTISSELNELGTYYKKIYKEKIGKEYYYNNELKGNKFTIGQLKNSKSYSLSRIENDKVVVRWKSNNGEDEWTSYRLENVLRLIRKKEWILIKL